jgi:hypothetical protein
MGAYINTDVHVSGYKLLAAAITVQLLTDANSYERDLLQQTNLEANKELKYRIEDEPHVPLPRTGTFPVRASPGPAHIQDNNTTTNSTEAPQPQPPETGSTPAATPSSNGSSKWAFFVIIPIAALSLGGLVCSFFVWNKKGMATIRPWRTGLSGLLQHAFITGND